MSRAGEMWLEGCTESGRTVRIERDPYLRANEGEPIIIDGEPANLTDRIRRMRDGGTTVIYTDAGRIHVPQTLIPERSGPPTLDGEVLS